MTPGQRLKKMSNRAKQIRKAHPKMTYQNAMKQAGAEMSGTKKKRGHTKAKTPRTKKRASVGAVVPDTATQSQLKSKLVKSLEEQTAWALLARQSAKNVTERKKQSKKVAELNRKLRSARSL